MIIPYHFGGHMSGEAGLRRLREGVGAVHLMESEPRRCGLDGIPVGKLLYCVVWKVGGWLAASEKVAHN